MKQTILSVFTGAGLLDRPFTELGAYVVSLGDAMLGHDIRKKNAPRGLFDGLIGGPPCQWASKARGEADAQQVNLIPEYMRIYEEAQPRWALMENVDVPATREYMGVNYPDWESVSLRDWDCGGRTNRIRRFWFKGVLTPSAPPRREGHPALSVLATSWRFRNHREGVHSALDPNAAAFLQGFPLLAHDIIVGLPDAVPDVAKQRFAVHMLGNGVPHAMGRFLAEWILDNT